MKTGVGEIIDIEEFPSRRAGAPDGQLRSAGNLGFMKPADQRGDDMAVFGMIIVTGTKQIGSA